MIHKIPVELFDQGFQIFSFDVVSLLTNVTLGKTISAIIDKVYKATYINCCAKGSIPTLQKSNVIDCLMRTILEKQIVILSQTSRALFTWRSTYASAYFKMWAFYRDCKLTKITGYWLQELFFSSKIYLLNAVLRDFRTMYRSCISLNYYF